MATDFLSGACIICSGDFTVDEETNKCVCPNKKAFDEEYKSCIECQPNSGINYDTRRCQEGPYDGHCINPDTGFWVKTVENQQADSEGICTCAEKYGYNKTTEECYKCGDDEFVDPETKQCMKCAGGELGVFNGHCINCSSIGGISDPTTHKCVCPNDYGFHQNTCSNCSLIGDGWLLNKETNECVFCTDIKDHCIDPTTSICRELEENEGIDLNSNKCRTCTDFDKYIDPTTKRCMCSGGKGYYPYSSFHNVCVDCTIYNKGFDPKTGKCVYCDDDKFEGIDSVTGECRKCNDSEGINYNNKQCQVCVEGGNRLNYCQCESGLGVTKENKCGECDFGEGIRSDNTCGKCDDKEGIDHKSRICRNINDGECINKTNNEIIDIPDGMKINNRGFCSCSGNYSFDPQTGICTDCKEKNLSYNIYSDSCMPCNGDGQITDENNVCNCPILKGFDPEYKNCISCKEKEGIDPHTRQCRPLNEEHSECINHKTGMILSGRINSNFFNYDIDENNYCRCHVYEYFNETTQTCDRCNDGENYNPVKGTCMSCPPGYGINYTTGECVETIFNDRVICPDKKGYDINYNCVECPVGYGISYLSLVCQKCTGYLNCMDSIGGICGIRADGVSIDPVTRVCGCPNGFGLNNITNSCTPCKSNEYTTPDTSHCKECPFGQIADPISHQCTKCKFGEGINYEKMVCEKCSPGYGVDLINGSCVKCQDNEGINQVNGNCEQCPSGQVVIDQTTRFCGICKNGFGVDSSQNTCKECSVENCLVCSSNYSYCTFCSTNYTSRNGLCEIDGIQVIEPTQTPAPVAIDISINGENEITFEKPEEVSENKTYQITLPSDVNDKTVVIKDMENAKVDLVIQKDTKSVTIKPNVNTKLDIVVGYSNIDDSNNEEQPVIIIDNSDEAAASADTSLKGEGQLTIQTKVGETLQLNQITPSKDKQIVIQSSSQVNVKQLDFYGNSKVEFTNKENKAVVNLVTLQQKASTELDNVIIDGNLTTGLFSIISLTENVNIDNANIEISASNQNVNSNPTIIGDLTSPPKKLTIKDRNVGDLLEGNDDYFVIAESNKNRFKCDEWIPQFESSSSDSKYKYAHCRDGENNLKQLYVDDKKNDDAKPDISGPQNSDPEVTGPVNTNTENTGPVNTNTENTGPANTNTENTGPDDNGSKSTGGGGLKKGEIAGIVIAVIVVVAAVIGVLVYFFVFRKRKSHSVNEDDDSNERNHNNFEEAEI